MRNTAQFKFFVFHFLSVLEMHKSNEDVQLFNSKLIGINKRGAVRFPPVTMEQSKALGSETSCKKNGI